MYEKLAQTTTLVLYILGKFIFDIGLNNSMAWEQSTVPSIAWLIWRMEKEQTINDD